MRKKAVVISVLTVAVCGCSAPTAVRLGNVSGNTSAVAAEPGVTTYLCTFTSPEVLLLQWQESQGYLSGTYQDDKITGTAPQESLSPSNGNVSGSVKGSGITVTLTGGFPTWYGTDNGSQITLNIPQQDGSISSESCNRASVSDWNSAVASLNNELGSDNGTVEQQQASASAAAQQQQTDQNAQSQMTSDLNTLQNFSLSSDLSSLSSDTQQIGNDLNTVKSDAANGQGQDCFNADQVASDADTVMSDQDSVSSDVDGLTNDIANGRQDVSAVNSDISTLQNLGLPVPSNAGSTVSGADNAISNAVSTANADISTVNQDAQAAEQVSAGLSASACSPPSPTNPIGEIS
jgi:hypothetical protein